MFIFDNTESLTNYLAVEYPKSSGKELASFAVSDMLLLVAVYEAGEVVHAFFLFSDRHRDYKWVLVDNFHAELSVRSYLDYIEEMEEALALFEVTQEAIDQEENSAFYENLD